MIAFRIILYFIAAISTAYGSGKIIYDPWIPDNKSAEVAFLIAGISLSSVFLPVLNEKKKKTIEQQGKLLGFLIKELRSNLTKDLEKQFKTKDINLNVRIFAPKRSILCWGKRIFTGKRVFYMKHMSSLSSDPIDGLSFIVFPEHKSQGLTGAAYTRKEMVCDFNLDKRRSEADYNLSKAQLEKAGHARFVIAAPIFGKSDNITSIVTFDSKKNITLPASDDWQNAIREACKLIHQCAPYLN